MWSRVDELERIGQGGFGQVIRIYDPARAAVFAAKRLLSNHFSQKDFVRFRREIHNLSLLSHENIVRVIEASDDADAPGYMMEYCPNGSLDSIVGQDGIDVHRADEIFEGVLKGLQAAHEHESGPIVHRDIKRPRQ